MTQTTNLMGKRMRKINIFKYTYCDKSK